MGVKLAIPHEVRIVCSRCGKEMTVTAIEPNREDGSTTIFARDCGCWASYTKPEKKE